MYMCSVVFSEKAAGKVHDRQDTETESQMPVINDDMNIHEPAGLSAIQEAVTGEQVLFISAVMLIL